MNQGSINSLLQCIVSSVNTSHSDKPDFSKRSGLPTPKSTDFFFFPKHAIRVCFKIQGVKMTPHLICPLPVSQCVVPSWHTYKQFLQCSRSDFFQASLSGIRTVFISRLFFWGFVLSS